jgi:putative spermidine/putrescine transport system permease protein
MSGRLQGPMAWLLVAVTGCMLVFILAPLLVTLAISFTKTAYVVFPPRGFTLQWYGKALQDQDFLSAMWFSTVLALAATAGALLLGVPAAFALGRSEFPGRDAVAWMLLSPLVFPVLITGVALLQLFSTLGFDNTPVNMLIGHVLVTAPYVVRTTTASLALADTTLEDAARTLGAGNWRVFRRITVPQIAPGLAAGALFAFMISFDNFPISLWLADAQNNPVPLLIFQMIANVFEPTVAAISTLMIMFAMAIVLILERIGGLQRATAM